MHVIGELLIHVHLCPTTSSQKPAIPTNQPALTLMQKAAASSAHRPESPGTCGLQPDRAFCVDTKNM